MDDKLRQKGHGGGPRFDPYVPSGTQFQPGRFGRMFSGLAPLEVDDAKLTKLADAMKDIDGAGGGDNAEIPAGFTYFGQFVDHDITFDPTTIPERAVDPQSVFNFRTPQLELDSVYRAGPEADRFLFDPRDRAKLLIGETRRGGGDPSIEPGMPNDLPRLFVSRPKDENDQTPTVGGTAVIGDKRNDENLVVAQTHLAFLKLHNKVVDELPASTPRDKRFAEARKKVVWHYQKIVLTDFVARLVQPAVLEDVLTHGRKFFEFQKEPFIPVEFSVAAYRLGHSMVREDYDYNRVFGFGPRAVTPATLGLLFAFSELSGSDLQRVQPMPVPSDWIIDWERFFDFKTVNKKANPTRLLDPLLVPALHELPGSSDQQKISLAFLNLRRGVRMMLPSGQAVAARMRLPILSAADLESGKDGAAIRELGLTGAAPLWHYILKEARVQEHGLRLGAVGSRIVAEVFVGLLEGDPSSYLAQDKNWKPDLPRVTTTGAANDYTMVDMLSFVGDLNPIGD